VVPHPEKVTPNSKARIHRDFGYGGEDSFYCAWGPRCAPAGCTSLSLFYSKHRACAASMQCLGRHLGCSWASGERTLGQVCLCYRNLSMLLSVQSWGGCSAACGAVKMCLGGGTETARACSRRIHVTQSVCGDVLVYGVCRNAVLGLGVADGVYMWRSRGIDSGVFSRSLMLSAKNAVLYGQVDVLNGAPSVLRFAGWALQRSEACASTSA
jgi:hypothetical protein